MPTQLAHSELNRIHTKKTTQTLKNERENEEINGKK